MTFIIDRDCYPDKEAPEGTNLNATGVMGPGNYTGDGSELKIKFKLLDDDQTVLYEGRMSEIDFEPLDCFGEPNAGCTGIQYYDIATEEWVWI